MSFTTELRDELGGLAIKSLCCRRAYLYGLLYGATPDPQIKDALSVTLPLSPAHKGSSSAEASEASMSPYDLVTHASGLIHTLLGRQPDITTETRGAHRYARLHFVSRPAAHRLNDLASLPEEEAEVDTLRRHLDFKCAHCAAHFLRGLTVAYGTVTDPMKGNHLELQLPDDGRVEPVRILFSESGAVPGRGVRTGGKSNTPHATLFFKSGSDIPEVLSHIGATSLVFRYYNAQIEHDIRNNENRATNCVTENINRSMRAGLKQTTAIRALAERDLLGTLSDDLRYTARLRLEHDDATLSELAALHEPPITKSGLNHRLEKILALYERSVAKIPYPLHEED